jgi:hypothetical protein
MADGGHRRYAMTPHLFTLDSSRLAMEGYAIVLQAM